MYMYMYNHVYATVREYVYVYVCGLAIKCTCMYNLVQCKSYPKCMYTMLGWDICI